MWKGIKAAVRFAAAVVASLTVALGMTVAVSLASGSASVANVAGWITLGAMLAWTVGE